MNNKTKEPQFIENLQITAAINFLLISLMLACFAFIFGKFVQIINPGWQAAGFTALAFFVAMESLLLRHFQREESRFSQNKVLGTMAEIILIILITKILSMMLDGFSTLWTQIRSWQEDFGGNFFDADTMFYILGILSIWLLTWLFSQPLTQLEEDHELMEQEKLGFVFTDRRKARRNLINLIFLLGVMMIVLMSLINYFSENHLINQTGSQTLLPVLILYFGAGFVFLSINQYAIMKTYWYLNGISVSPDLVKRWFFYTIMFIIFVIFIIIFLPNDFTVGFDPLIEITAQVFLYLFTILQFLVVFPIVFVITLISSLFSGEPAQNQIQDQIQEYVPIAPQISSQTPWLELFKSILFWLVFITIIVFSARFYFKNNIHIKSFLNNFRFGRWLKDLWKWIKEGFSKFKQTASTKYKKGLKNIHIYFKERQKKLSKLAGITRRMPPRQDVIMTYLEWIRWNHQSGRKRKKSQTPLEFAQTCNQFNNEASGLVNTFTNTFITARYSNHPINEAQAQEAKRLLITLKEVFEQKQENQVTNREGKS